MAPIPPQRPKYEIAQLSDVPSTATGGHPGLEIPGRWKQLRHHFGIKEFSANAFISTRSGEEIVHEHFERANDDPTKPGDEELYFVATGRALVRLDGEAVEVGPGTCVFVGDPSVARSFTALEPETTILTIGTNPGVEFIVSEFERDVSPPPRWS